MKLEPGTTVMDLHVFIESATVGTTKNGSKYLSLRVKDSKDSVNAVLWNASDEVCALFVAGKTACITANVNQYKGKNQLVIESFKESHKTPADFMSKTSFDIEELYAKVLKRTADMKEGLPRLVGLKILEDYKEQLKRSPAATSVHNNWVGGLLEHAWSASVLADSICDHYIANYSVNISRCKVVFGAMYHDFAKILEYNAEDPSFSITPNGVLCNHLVMGPVIIYDICEKMKRQSGEKDVTWVDQERNHLMHIIASHHGRLDFGSPVKPASLEAVLVHQIDMVDSKFMHALGLIRKGEGPIAGFSEKSYFEGVPYKI